MMKRGMCGERRKSERNFRLLLIVIPSVLILVLGRVLGQ